jgi:hypothetical protein
MFFVDKVGVTGIYWYCNKERGAEDVEFISERIYLWT